MAGLLPQGCWHPYLAGSVVAFVAAGLDVPGSSSGAVAPEQCRDIRRASPPQHRAQGLCSLCRAEQPANIRVCAQVEQGKGRVDISQLPI